MIEDHATATVRRLREEKRRRRAALAAVEGISTDDLESIAQLSGAERAAGLSAVAGDLARELIVQKWGSRNAENRPPEILKIRP